MCYKTIRQLLSVEQAVQVLLELEGAEGDEALSAFLCK